MSGVRSPVPVADWHAEVAERRAAGFTYLDVLTAIDRSDGVEVVACLMDPDSRASCLVATFVDDDCVDSITDLFDAASWHERETAELFGVTFTGHPDPRPLVTRGDQRPALRKTTPLTARQRADWPGAEPGRRRASRPPGVLDSWDQP